MQKRKGKARAGAREVAGIKVVFTEEEVGAIVDACNRQRQMIPTYLVSRQGELAVLNSILEKLAPSGQ